MGTFTVALLQLAPNGPDLQNNLAVGEAACRQAKNIGADLALFPEMWSNGYTSITPWGPGGSVYEHPRRGSDTVCAELPKPQAIWAGQAISPESSFVDHFTGLAAELDMAIALTYLQQWDGLPRNTVSVIDRHGRIVLTYAKVHTCAFALPEAALTPGDSFEVAALDTVDGSVMVGAMICYDREFPESARALMLAGAEVILTPNACALETNRIAQFRSRAYENMTALALANYAGPGMGHSIAFDGIAFHDGRSRDMLTIEAGEHPGIYPAIFDLESLRTFRRQEVWGDAFRRPSTYQSLTSGEVHEPFIRVSRTGNQPPR